MGKRGLLLAAALALSAGSAAAEPLELRTDSAVEQDTAAFDTPAYNGLDLKLGSPLKFFDTGNVHYISFVPPTTLAGTVSFTLPATDGPAGSKLTTNGSGVLGWADTGKIAADWLTADGSTKTITHGWGTRDLSVQVFDSNGATILVDVTRDTTNTVTLTSVAPPTGNGYRVLLDRF